MNIKNIFGFILSLVLIFGITAPSRAVFHGKREGANEKAGEVKERTRTKVENVKERVGEKKEKVRTNLEEKRNDLKERKDEVKNRIEEKKGEIREKREEVRKKVERIKFARAKKFFERMAGRYAALIERLENITDRAEKRIAKLKEKGIDTARFEPLLLNVRSEIESARAKLAEIKEKFAALESSEDAKVSFEEVKAASGQMKERLRAIHRALTNLVRELKASRELRVSPSPTVTPSPTATPTESPTPSPTS